MHRRMTTGALAVTMAGILALSAWFKDGDSDSDTGARHLDRASSKPDDRAVGADRHQGQQQRGDVGRTPKTRGRWQGPKCDPTTIAMAGALTTAPMPRSASTSATAPSLTVDEHNATTPTARSHSRPTTPRVIRSHPGGSADRQQQDIVNLIGPAFSR